MDSSEYDDILASLQALTHRAYQLGRSEALKRVIAVMQADDTPTKPLALMAPTPEAPHHGASDAAEPAPAVDPVPKSQPNVSPDPGSPVPWWARPARPMISSIRQNGTTTH